MLTAISFNQSFPCNVLLAGVIQNEACKESNPSFGVALSENIVLLPHLLHPSPGVLIEMLDISLHDKSDRCPD